MDETDAEAARPRRPFLVYLVVAYVILSAAWTIAGVWLLFTAGEGGPVTAEIAELRAAIGPVDIAFMAVLVVLNLLGAFFLFALSRHAVALFAAVVAVTLVNQVWLFVFRQDLLAAQGPLVGIVGLVLPLFILLYANRLRTRGVLS